jgi:hypothetical protein
LPYPDFSPISARVQCKEAPVPRDRVDEQARAFIRDLLLSPRRLFSWWEEQHAATAETRAKLEENISLLEVRVKTTTEKYHRVLDRLTDNLDADEVAYYSQQRDSLKQLLTEYREELEKLLGKRETVEVEEDIITDFMQMGEQYREVLETSEDFTFWRGLVDDLDITGIIGTDGDRRYVEFIVFGKSRKRFYLIPEALPQFHQEEADPAKIDISGRSRVRPPARV